MFGHQDDKKDGIDDEAPKQDGAVAEVAMDIPAGNTSEDQGQDLPAASSDSSQAAGTPDNDAAGDDDTKPAAPAADDDDAWQHPGEPIDDAPEQISDIIGPSGGHNAAPAPPMPVNRRDYSDDDDDVTAKTPHELIDIKQKALGELQPLMGQLDQSPEDKFRTIMMIIQASDNQDMIKQAYEAAEAIKDEKIRAQALLDLVNEINYFTQHSSQE